jgi:hypothetical protein
MDQRLEDRIEGWDSKPLTGGFAELRELADGGFSGVARTGRTTLYMLNGRVVGVFGGSIDDFEGTEATVYRAPHPSLPLLFAMKQHGGEQQAKYYTNDTPISQAHQQLTDAGFTGYIELSENVLSGDYYVLYYGGRSMSCAFVGNADRLEVGDEAFDLADDEVGIYEVMSVNVEVTDIPAPGGAGRSVPGTQQDTGGAGGTDRTTGAATDVGQSDAADTGSTAEASPTDQSGGTDHTEPSAPGESHPSASSERQSERADSQQPGGASADASGAGGAGSRDSAVGDDSSAAADSTAAADSSGAPRDEQAPEGTEMDASAGGTTGDAGPSADTTQDAGQAPDPDPGQSGDADTGGAETNDTAAASTASTGQREETEGGGSAAGSRQGTATGSADASAADSTADATVDEQAADQHPRDEAAADRAVEAASGPMGSSATSAATASEGVPKSRASYGELQAIPSLSPDHTAVAEPGQERAVRDDAGSGDDATSSGSAESTTSQSTAVADDDAVGRGQSGTGDRPGTDVAERASQAVDVDVDTGGEQEPVPDDAGSEEVRQQLSAREDRIQQLEAAITDLRVQRDGLTDERDRLEAEVERLEGEVADLEAEVERLRSQLDDGTRDKQRMTRDDALAGTNLFVRYGSKGGGTLENAHAGEAGKEEVNENLRIEHHTQFEADDVVVEDQSYDRFLRGTIYRSFVEWVVRELLYEIQDTGHVKALREVYDAIPQIDRAELLGDVSVQFTEDGEQYREQRSFDVVLRDRMGNPLIVANLNDSRNPADREMMETVIGNGIDVKESNESLSSALMVTSSFFKPGALEAADEAHGGGLLSRDAKQSYVKLDRKRGFHLILVESREGDFHVNVPEL